MVAKPARSYKVIAATLERRTSRNTRSTLRNVSAFRVSLSKTCPTPWRLMEVCTRKSMISASLPMTLSHTTAMTRSPKNAHQATPEGLLMSDSKKGSDGPSVSPYKSARPASSDSSRYRHSMVLLSGVNAGRAQLYEAASALSKPRVSIPRFQALQWSME